MSMNYLNMIKIKMDIYYLNILFNNIYILIQSEIYIV